jgi:integrase
MSLKLRYRTWSAKIFVPEDVRRHFGGRTHIERSLGTSDRKEAEVAHKQLVAEIAARIHELRTGKAPAVDLRAIYQRERMQAAEGEYQVFMAGADDQTPEELGIEFEIEKIADQFQGEGKEMPPHVEARLQALQDAFKELQGENPPVPQAYAMPFSEAAKGYLDTWERSATRREGSNTRQQKLATFHLWQGYWGDKPMAGIRQRDATGFQDVLRRLDPNWARTLQTRNMPWQQLMAKFGNHPKGLSQSSINRHMGALEQLWDWAKARGHCDGVNPFAGQRTRVKRGVNAQTYQAWETDELKRLLSNPPRRRDLHEIMLVAMFSGLRINEVAALTWGQLKEADGTPYFQIVEAKTEAGKRQVPVHARLQWLVERGKDKKDGRIWPTFNLEGPGKRPGADASKAFSDYKRSLGFQQRTKTFHSFRKNVTRIIERAGVPENQWAQVLGHERGFTYSVYNPDGLSIANKAAIIALLEYPELPDELLQPPGEAL